jgi:hypothetical protein
MQDPLLDQSAPARRAFFHKFYNPPTDTFVIT